MTLLITEGINYHNIATFINLSLIFQKAAWIIYFLLLR